MCMQSFIFASSFDGINGSNDTLKTQSSQPKLVNHGVEVYKDGRLLTNNEVLNILSSNPKIEVQYQKGKDLRSTGGLLLFGGSIAMVGGIAMMVSGIETYTENNGYYSESYTEATDKYYMGVLVTAIGELMFNGGIACTVIGKIQIQKSIRNYNAQYKSGLGYQPGKINYQLGLLDNGQVGFRLSF
jgi:hypothetical protein